MNRESQVDRIDAALAELRRLGRTQRHAHHRQHAHHRPDLHGEGRSQHWRERRMVGLARHRMLSVLAERPGLGVTELANAIGVDQPRASRLVNDAADSGLIRRSPDPRDGRRSVVELTASGRAHLETSRRERREAVEAGLAGFSESETAAFAELLERFAAALRESPPAPDPSVE